MNQNKGQSKHWLPNYQKSVIKTKLCTFVLFFQIALLLIFTISLKALIFTPLSVHQMTLKDGTGKETNKKELAHSFRCVSSDIKKQSKLQL